MNRRTLLKLFSLILSQFNGDDLSYATRQQGENYHDWLEELEGVKSKYSASAIALPPQTGVVVDCTFHDVTTYGTE